MGRRYYLLSILVSIREEGCVKGVCVHVCEGVC